MDYSFCSSNYTLLLYNLLFISIYSIDLIPGVSTSLFTDRPKRLFSQSSSSIHVFLFKSIDYLQNTSNQPKQHSGSSRRRATQFNLKSYVQDTTIPNYNLNQSEFVQILFLMFSPSRIISFEFKNQLSNAREYLQSAVPLFLLHLSQTSLDMNHMRACALLEMRYHNFDEARAILRPCMI